MCVKIRQKWISEVCFTLRHLEKIFLSKLKKFQFFPSRPRPALGLLQAGPRPASIFEKIGTCLSVKCKKWFLRNFESVYKKSGLTKFEIMFLKYRITKRKAIWLHIRFGFQIFERPASGRPGRPRLSLGWKWEFAYFNKCDYVRLSLLWSSDATKVGILNSLTSTLNVANFSPEVDIFAKKHSA